MKIKSLCDQMVYMDFLKSPLKNPPSRKNTAQSDQTEIKAKIQGIIDNN